VVGKHQPQAVQIQVEAAVAEVQTLTPTLFQEQAAQALSFFAIKSQRLMF
jgi:hypothetical protein